MLKRARIALENANKTEEMRMFNCMDTIVYTAFAMEAFINHLGLHLDDDWTKKEKKKSKYIKLEDLKSQLSITTGKFDKPYKSINDAFHYRDLLAHGRTETIIDIRKVLLTETEKEKYTIENEWMELSTLENAEQIFTDTEEVIAEMYTTAGVGEYPFLRLHGSVHSFKVDK